MARAERPRLAGTHGAGRVEVTLDVTRVCQSGRRPPEKFGGEYYKFTKLCVIAGNTDTGGESIKSEYGGEGGVRTHVGLTPPTDFESVPL